MLPGPGGVAALILATARILHQTILLDVDLAILDRFLARPAIYATAHFRDLLERQARANLDEALRRLRG